jgi:hypothetical protein
MAPKDVDPQTWQESLVRESLCVFGDSDVVQSAFFSNSFNGGWGRAGNLSLRNRKNPLVQARAELANQTIASK